jgi:hypothetical protein
VATGEVERDWVLTRRGETGYRKGERLAAETELPSLAPAVEQLFAQIDR